MGRSSRAHSKEDRLRPGAGRRYPLVNFRWGLSLTRDPLTLVNPPYGLSWTMRVIDSGQKTPRTFAVD